MYVGMCVFLLHGLPLAVIACVTCNQTTHDNYSTHTDNTTATSTVNEKDKTVKVMTQQR